MKKNLKKKEEEKNLQTTNWNRLKKKATTFIQQNVAYVFRKNIYMIILSFM